MTNWFMYALIAAAFAILVVISWPASAQQNWPQSEFSTSQDVVIIPRKTRKIRPRKVRRTVKRQRRRKVSSARLEDLNGFKCARPVTVTGQVKASEKRAQDSAWSQYHLSIKFALGEKFADERFARDVKWQCIRSRSESFVGKTAAAVGGSVDRYRCQMSARPCAPPRE